MAENHNQCRDLLFVVIGNGVILELQKYEDAMSELGLSAFDIN